MGNWKEIKGKVKQFWSKLTDDDLQRINGNVDELVGKLQKTYGYTKEQAWNEFEKYKSKLGSSSSSGSEVTS